MHNSENHIKFELWNCEKFRIHAYLILALLKNPTITITSITSLAVFLGCFEEDSGRSDRIVEGLSEELYFAINPRNEKEGFFFYELLRYMQEVVAVEDQIQLLTLLRREKLE